MILLALLCPTNLRSGFLPIQKVQTALKKFSLQQKHYTALVLFIRYPLASLNISVHKMAAKWKQDLANGRNGQSQATAREVAQRTIGGIAAKDA